MKKPTYFADGGAMEGVRMPKARALSSVAFCALALAVVFSAFGYKAAGVAGLLPESLDNGTESYLEGAMLQTLPDLTIESVAEGTFQAQAEDYLSGLFPARDDALMANAAMQRRFIELANVPFGFDAWPTTFESTVVADADGMLYARPLPASDELAIALRAGADAVNGLVQNHPECDFACYVPDRSNFTSANPAKPLMSNPAGADFLEGNFADLLEAGVACTIETHEAKDEYFADYFHSDHHWNMQGAYKAYETLAGQLGVDALNPEGIVSYDQYPFYGSNARLGRYFPTADYLFDYAFDMPDMKTFHDGVEFQRDERQDYVDGTVDEKRAESWAYSYYFGCDLDCIVYENGECPTGEKLLVIGDSFMKPIEPLLASGYSEAHVIDPRAFAGSVDAYISKHGIDDVAIIASAHTLRDIGSEGLFR